MQRNRRMSCLISIDGCRLKRKMVSIGSFLLCLKKIHWIYLYFSQCIYWLIRQRTEGQSPLDWPRSDSCVCAWQEAISCWLFSRVLSWLSGLVGVFLIKYFTPYSMHGQLIPIASISYWYYLICYLWKKKKKKAS